MDIAQGNDFNIIALDCPEYYAQIQFLLMITKADLSHFSSYDPRFKEKRKQVKIIEIHPDQKFQDNLDIRIQLAEIEKKKIINEFLNAA